METRNRDGNAIEDSSNVKSGDIASHIFIILVTLVQLIFFTWFHKYIAWNVTSQDGSVIRLSLLTDAYFVWLSIMITGSNLVIAAYIGMIIYYNYKFYKLVDILSSIIGVIIAGSLAIIFPFDFSVLPNATAVDIVPIIVRVFFIALAIFYAVSAFVHFTKLKKYSDNLKESNEY